MFTHKSQNMGQIQKLKTNPLKQYSNSLLSFWHIFFIAAEIWKWVQNVKFTKPVNSIIIINILVGKNLKLCCFWKYYTVQLKRSSLVLAIVQFFHGSRFHKEKITLLNLMEVVDFCSLKTYMSTILFSKMKVMDIVEKIK